jgi:hypothetical protein
MDVTKRRSGRRGGEENLLTLKGYDELTQALFVSSSGGMALEARRERLRW